MFFSLVWLGACARYTALQEPSGGQPDGGSDAGIDAGADAGNGRLVWVVRAGGNERDRLFRVSALGDGSSFVTGTMQRSSVFGEGEANETRFEAAGDYAYMYVARYNADGTLAWARRGVAVGGLVMGRDVVALPDGSCVVVGEFGGTATLGENEDNRTTLSSSGLGDVLVARFRADGTLDWARRAGGEERDQGFGVDALADGSVLVTGMFRGRATFGAGEVNQTVLAPLGDGDVFLAKYGSNGDLVWATRAGGGRHDAGFSVSAAEDGSAFVAGSFRGTALFGGGEPRQASVVSSGEDDVFLARFGPGGELEWVRRIGGPGSESVEGVEALGDGSALVAGTFLFDIALGDGIRLESAGGTDIFIARYGPDGTVAWARREGADEHDFCTGIDALPDGSFALGGRADPAALGAGDGVPITSDCEHQRSVVARYGPDGKLRGVGCFSSSTWYFGHGVSILPDGSALTTASFSGTLYFDQGGDNETKLLAYPSRAVFLARYGPGGAFTWAVAAKGLTDDGKIHCYPDESGKSVFAFDDGSSLVAGSFSGSAAFGPGEGGETTLTSSGFNDVFVARHRPDGELEWVLQAGASGGCASARRVVGLSDGSFLLTGEFQLGATFGRGGPNETTLVSSGYTDVFVARYDPGGGLTWARRAGGEGEDRGVGIAVLGDGSFLLTGSFGETAVFGPGESGQAFLDSSGRSDVFVARYDRDGSLVWVRRGGGEEFDEPGDIAAMPDESFLVVGHFMDVAGLGEGEPNERWMTSRGWEDVFVARYDPDGALDWARRVGGEKPDFGEGILALDDGSCLITGSIKPPTVFGYGEENETWLGEPIEIDRYFYLARYDPAGVLDWVKGATGGFGAAGVGIAPLPGGAALVVGWFETDVTLGSGEPNQTTLQSIGEDYCSNVFVARYNRDGTLAWARYVVGLDCFANGIDSVSDGSSLLTGEFSDTATFDPGGRDEASVTAVGRGDVFLIRIGP